LNYNKLYHNKDGGYSMDKLKRVMQRLKQDKEDGLHPFLDPTQEKEL